MLSSLKEKNKVTVNLKTVNYCTALFTMLMMTAESMLSKRPVLRIIASLFFFLKHCISYQIYLHLQFLVYCGIIEIRQSS